MAAKITADMECGYPPVTLHLPIHPGADGQVWLDGQALQLAVYAHFAGTHRDQ